MRIIIDTELNSIIVPDSYYMQLDKLNEVIEAAGGTPLDYTKYVKGVFEKAYENPLLRASDVAKVN